MRTIVLTDALASLAIVGRTRFTFKLPVDAQLSLADGDDFLLLSEYERPITTSHLYDAVVAAYGTLIANDAGDVDTDGKRVYTYDAGTGPAVSAVTLYRVEGELQILRPTAADKRDFKKVQGRDMLVETLPGVVVQSRTRYLNTLPEDVRGLVVLDVPKAWSDAADKRASKAIASKDAKPIAAPVVSDTTMSRILVEDVAEARARRAFAEAQKSMLVAAHAGE